MESKYIHTSDVHNLAAPNVIVPYLVKTFDPMSVADVGCGLATFLSVFKINGVKDILGIDGSWVKKEQLFVSVSEFMEADLEKSYLLSRTFDLVLCLEVAEHLKEESADIIVNNLVSLGNTIIFSAAVPNQGGQNHLNEQDFSYWQEKFAKHDFHFYDIFRQKFWNTSEIDWWYKQNMFLVAHSSVKFSDDVNEKRVIGKPLLFIHPETLATRVSQLSNSNNQIEAIKNGKISFSVYFTALRKKTVNGIKKFF